MKLRDLEAQFLRIATRDNGEGGTYNVHQIVEAIAEADGLQFLCPGCFEANHGPIGTHVIICWFAKVGPAYSPSPGRWNAEGTGLDDITFVPPGQFSVQIVGGCNWHGFVEHGEANTR